MALADMTIEGYVQRLGSADPTPGGGSASAVVGALGASLVRMVALLTAKSPKTAAFAERAAAIANDAESLAAKFTAAIDEDVVAFDRVTAAYAMAKGSESEKAARTAAIQESLLGACDPPLRAIDLSRRACALTVELVEFGNQNAISDIGCAALFLHAAAQGASLNVAINAKALKDRAVAEQLLGRMHGDLAQVGLLAEVVSSKVKTAIGARV